MGTIFFCFFVVGELCSHQYVAGYTKENFTDPSYYGQL